MLCVMLDGLQHRMLLGCERLETCVVWESDQLIETSYAMFRYLGGEFLWWMLLGGLKRRTFL